MMPFIDGAAGAARRRPAPATGRRNFLPTRCAMMIATPRRAAKMPAKAAFSYSRLAAASEAALPSRRRARPSPRLDGRFIDDARAEHERECRRMAVIEGKWPISMMPPGAGAFAIRRPRSPALSPFRLDTTAS